MSAESGAPMASRVAGTEVRASRTKSVSESSPTAWSRQRVAQVDDRLRMNRREEPPVSMGHHRQWRCSVDHDVHIFSEPGHHTASRHRPPAARITSPLARQALLRPLRVRAPVDVGGRRRGRGVLLVALFTPVEQGHQRGSPEMLPEWRPSADHDADELEAAQTRRRRARAGAQVPGRWLADTGARRG